MYGAVFFFNIYLPLLIKKKKKKDSLVMFRGAINAPLKKSELMQVERKQKGRRIPKITLIEVI